MKDIKENQKGLKSLAAERPDVVKKMGYDPESFYAGGLAMLAEGGDVASQIAKLLGDFQDEETDAMPGSIGMPIGASKPDVNILGKSSMDPDDAIEEYKKRQEIEELSDQKKDEELLGLSEGGILDNLRRGIAKIGSFIPGSMGESFDSSPSVELTEEAKEGIEKIIGEENLTEKEKIEKIAEEADKNIKSKKDKALGIAEALGGLAGAMPQGMMSRGFVGQAIGPSQVPFRRVGMANRGLMDLLSLIDESPLSEEEKAVQKQLINLQIGQQTLPLSPQYVASDAPYKAVYRPYFSEVTKAYNQARPNQPFSAMVAPPQERVDFNLGLQADGRLAAPRRVAGIEYAADGMLIDGKFFPEEDNLVSGPGGEREDKIPAMLSDGEFVVNARTVRGLGMQMGADPMDLEEQKDIGAMVLEYLQDTLGPDGEMAEKIGEEGLGALVRSMA